MATSYPALSRVIPNAYSFGLIANTLSHSSPLNQSTRTVSVPGAHWRFAAEYRALGEADFGLLQGFFAQLQGRGGRFTAWPMHRQWPLGTCRATSATASAASLLATSITAASLGASVTLLPGDFFAVSGYLYCVTTAMTATGGGAGTIAFKPGLRVAHSNGAALTFYRPSTTFMLMSDESFVNVMPGKLADVTVDAVETFL